MCETSDLVVMVVEPDILELQKTCDSLNKIGITKIVCVDTYTKAIIALNENKDIDIVVADFQIEPNKALGLLLCTASKKKYPGLFFVLLSKQYCYSIVLESIGIGAEDILDKNREGEIEQLMLKWINLAKHKNITREILHGKVTGEQ
jgi:hypothetical protein